MFELPPGARLRPSGMSFSSCSSCFFPAGFLKRRDRWGDVRHRYSLCLSDRQEGRCAPVECLFRVTPAAFLAGFLKRRDRWEDVYAQDHFADLMLTEYSTWTNIDMVGMERGTEAPRGITQERLLAVAYFIFRTSISPGRFTSLGLHSAKARGLRTRRIVEEREEAKDVLPVRSKGRVYPRRGVFKKRRSKSNNWAGDGGVRSNIS